MQMPLLRSKQNASGSQGAQQRAKNPVLPVLIILGIFCALVIGFNLMGKYVIIPSIFKNMKQPAITVPATTAKPVTWTPGIEAVGTAKAVRGVDVAAEVGGVVKAINFTSNTKAEAGQVLVQIDDAVERADMIAAEANIHLFETQLTRVIELKRKGVNSQASLDDARNQLDVAKSSYARLAATTEKKAITAQFGGTLGIARIDVGQYIEPGTVVVTLQDLSSIKVDFMVPEQNAGEIEIGRKARFGESFEDLSYDGQIVGIDPKVDPATRLVAVQAVIDNSSGRIQPGQFLRVRVDLPARDGVIALPQTAVTPSLYGDFVYIAEAAPVDEAAKKDEKKDAAATVTPTYIARQTFVTTGRRSGAMIEIVSGVKAGDMVVTAGENKLRPGAPIAIDNSIDPAAMAIKGAEEIK